MKINKFKINGSKIASYRVAGVRMISVSVVVKAGAWYENEKQSGYFHLLEHLILNGTDKFKNYQEISDYKERFGISNNAATSGEWMEFWFDFPDIYIKEGLEFAGQFLFHSIITFENIKNELSIVEQEYFDSWSSPYKKFSVEVGKRLAGEKSNVVNEVLGRPETFKNATQEELRKTYRKFFRPERMNWGISGNFKNEEIKEILKEIIPKENSQQENKLVIKNFKPKMGRILFKNKVDQPYLRIIWEIPLFYSLKIPLRYGLNLFNYLLGSSSNSSLFTKIRQEKGLVYRINSGIWDWPNVSYLEIYASTDQSKIETVINESQKILEELINNPIEKERFNRAINFLDLNTLMSYNSPTKIAHNLSFSYFYDNDVFTPKKTIEMAHSANIEKTQKWLKKYLDPKKQLIAVMVSDQSSNNNNDRKESQQEIF